MSDLPGENYHAVKSLEIHNRLARASGMSPHQAMYDMACAQNLATLALAYEQRTANLIAVATAVSENGVYQLDPALIGAAQEELSDRLGLGDNK